MANYLSFSGTITRFTDFWIGTNDDGGGCYKIMTVEDGQGQVVNFVVEPGTYFVNHITVHTGDEVTGFYDANVPVPMIYPPQYRAVVMSALSNDQFVKVDYFNDQLVSSDGQLALNVAPLTSVLLENGQHFNGDLEGRNLIVSYSATTKSIPAQTTPSQIIVMC